MKKLIILLVGLAILCCCVGIVSAQPVTPLPPNQTVRVSADIGENYIQWSWKLGNGSLVNSPVDIYLDDASTPIVTGYLRQSYLVLDLKPSERHNIEILDSTNQTLLGSATATTLISSYVIYFMMALCFIIMIIAFAMQELIKFLLLSIFNIILSVLSASLSSGHGIIPYVFFGIATLTGVILLVQGVPKLKDEIDWL